MTAFERFKQSMAIDYVTWHDGEGYDIDAIRAATPEERAAIEALILELGIKDWRDVEALAELKSPALAKAAASPNAEVRLAVQRYAPETVSEETRAEAISRALKSAEFGEGLSEAIDQAAEFHPPSVVDALLRGALHRDPDAAVNFAALLFYIYGKAKEPFDWEHRPFFLRFRAEGANREAAFRELCEEIGINPAAYL